MSAEHELRAALVAWAPLVAVVPAARISVDSVPPGTARPYIVFVKQRSVRHGGLDGSVHARQTSIDVQIVGSSREQALQVRDLVETALDAQDVPWEDNSSGYDPDTDVEAEVLSVDWWT